jgi:hypothetical protein
MGICFIVFFRFSISLPAVDGLVGICVVLDSDAIESIRHMDLEMSVRHLSNNMRIDSFGFSWYRRFTYMDCKVKICHCYREEYGYIDVFFLDQNGYIDVFSLACTTHSYIQVSPKNNPSTQRLEEEVNWQ